MSRCTSRLPSAAGATVRADIVAAYAWKRALVLEIGGGSVPDRVSSGVSNDKVVQVLGLTTIFVQICLLQIQTAYRVDVETLS
jgi:hypothetical protein